MSRSREIVCTRAMTYLGHVRGPRITLYAGGKVEIEVLHGDMWVWAGDGRVRETPTDSGPMGFPWRIEDCTADLGRWTYRALERSLPSECVRTALSDRHPTARQSPS